MVNRVPDDACCLKCGYRLRGLTESRCPECGEAFSAEQFNSFVVRWPGMMVWFLAASFIPVIFRGVAAWPWLRWSVKDGGLFGRYLADSYFIPGFDWSFRSYAAQLLMAATLGVGAIVGLIRHRDWGRKLAIITLLGFSAFNLIMMASAFSDVPKLQTPFAQMLTTQGFTSSAAVLYSDKVWQVWTDAVEDVFQRLLPCLVMVWFMLTSLRPLSLARGLERRPRAMSKDLYDPKHDRLMLLAILLCWIAMIEASVVFHQISGVVRYPSAPWYRTGSGLLGHAGGLVGLGVVILTPFAILRIWRRPERERAVVLWVCAATAVSLAMHRLSWVVPVPGIAPFGPSAARYGAWVGFVSLPGIPVMAVLAAAFHSARGRVHGYAPIQEHPGAAGRNASRVDEQKLV